MRIRLFHFAILLLATTATAQEDPWKPEVLDADAIAQRRQELEKSLVPPGKDASDEDKAWFTARSRRVELLGELEQAVRAYRTLPAAEESEAEKARIERDLAEQRAKAESTLPEIRESADLAPIEKAARNAAAEDEGARAALERLREAGREFEKGVQNATAREPEVRAQIERFADATAGSLQAYRKVNGQLELRLLDLFSKLSSETRKRLDAAVSAAQSRRDLTKLVATRTAKLLEAGRAVVQQLAAKEAEESRAEASRLADQAKRESDPLYRALTEIRADVTARRGRIKEDEHRKAELERERRAGKSALARYERQYAQIQRRVEERRSISRTTAEMLDSTLANVKDWRREIEDSVRRRIDRAIDAVLYELGPLQDLLWTLDAPVEELPMWAPLSEALEPERREEARRELEAAIDGEGGLLDSVRGRIQSLEQIQELLGEIDSLNDAQANALARLESLIRSHIYWVQTDSRLGLALFGEAIQDLERLREFYAEPEFLGEMRVILARRPAVFASMSLLLLLLLVGATIGARRIRARPMEPPRKGEHLRRGLADAGRMLVHAIAPSVILLVTAALVVRLELPHRLTFPLRGGLRVVSFLLFVQRLTWGLLSERGFLVGHFGVDPGVGKQVIRSVRLYAFAGMVFWIPYRILGDASVDLHALERLFGTAFRFCELLAVALLLPRKLPVARAFVSGSEVGIRVLGVLNPVLYLALLLIVGMDLFGYRYGAIYFTERVMSTIVAVVILRALYAGLNQISGRVTERVRERAFREQGGSAAWEDSSIVTRQLTRLITTGVIVAAAVLIGRSWDFTSSSGSILSEWELGELSDGVVLTAKDVFTALIFVLGAHFVSANIAGIFELLVFPIFGKVHRGTRFVVLSLSRYLLLIIGYGAALVSVHFSIASLGWLLAAVSVGLGFGLQEIVANFVSGLILLVEQPVRVGDIITVGDSGGTVERITIRSTVVTNWDQQQIIIPNKAFITQNLTNWTRNNNFTRRVVLLNVAYGSDVEQVFRVLEETIKSVENVRTYPQPRIWFDGFGEFALEFKIWIYVDIDYGLATLTEVRRRIFARFREEGIEIPFPQRDIHIRNGSTEELQGMAGMLEPKPEDDAPAEGSVGPGGN